MIICEIGLNHMGDKEYANEYVDAIRDSKADGVLFHIREAPFYEKDEGAKLLLPDEYYLDIAKRLKENGIKFGITIADLEKVDFLEIAGVDFYKIFSRDIGHTSLINRVARTQKPVFVSTGMSSMADIRQFVESIEPHRERFVLVHTQLANDIDAVNLKAIETLKETFGMRVGYGNHAANTKVLYLALAYEPSDILFYVKGARFPRHIDDPHAVNLTELGSLIDDLRGLPKALGKGVKLKMESKIR